MISHCPVTSWWCNQEQSQPSVQRHPSQIHQRSNESHPHATLNHQARFQQPCRNLQEHPYDRREVSSSGGGQDFKIFTTNKRILLYYKIGRLRYPKPLLAIAQPFPRRSGLGLWRRWQLCQTCCAYMEHPADPALVPQHLHSWHSALTQYIH